MKQTIAFSEKDEYLNAGVPSVISAHSNFKQNASIMKSKMPIVQNH